MCLHVLGIGMNRGVPDIIEILKIRTLKVIIVVVLKVEQFGVTMQ